MDSQDWMGWYVCVAYAVFLIVCALGAFSSSYAANLLQRVALLLHAGGSTIKTIRHIRAGKKFRRRSGDTITGGLHD